MKEVLDRMKRNCAERDYNLAVLSLWEAVKSAGHSWEDVEVFTFRPEFLTPAERKIYNSKTYGEKCGYSHRWHNCVRLKDGTLQPIRLMRHPHLCDFINS